MELLNAIILLLSTALPLIAAAVTFIAKFVKSDKAKKAAENLIKINDIIEEFMVKAEKFEGYTGEQKKNYVLRCVKNFALRDGIEINEANAGEVIEKLIGFSKSVNSAEYCLESVIDVPKAKAHKKQVNNEAIEANENNTLENTKSNKIKEKK